MKLYNSKLKGKSSDTDEGEEDFSNSGLKLFNNRLIVNRVETYINENIGPVSMYTNLLHYGNSMEQHDQLTIYMDSNGGYLDSALAIIDMMERTEGQVVVHITGDAGSAAGIIALAAPNLIVGNRARMFCHAASYGMAGKQGDVENMVNFNSKELKTLVKEVYHGFMQEEEIELMLLGRDYWMNKDEIVQRLENRAKLQQEEESAAMAVEELAKEEARVALLKPEAKPKRKILRKK